MVVRFLAQRDACHEHCVQQVAAYKKWALVHLIHNGKLPALPRWTPVAVSRAVKLEGGPYQVQNLYGII